MESSIFSNSMVIALFALFAIVAIIIILFIISNQEKSRLVDIHNEIVSEFHNSNKDVINSLNKEVSYLNEIKPEWNLHQIENKIRDVSYYKKTHNELEEIVELSYIHDKKFDDMFNDTEKDIMKYEITIENFFKKYRKYHDKLDKSFFLARALYNNGDYHLVERIYEVLLGEKHNKEFMS